jgi:aminoglycoside phosphotransferase family enzyme
MVSKRHFLGAHMAGELRDDRRISVDLDTKVTILKQPATYPDRPTQVDVIETHMSWVFLTTHYAYKLKKPVRYDFLDFSTLTARRCNCEHEVRLNRRLAHDVYLGVVALVVDAAGRLVLEQSGEPVEWLVKMRRLPAEHMLEHLITRGKVYEEDLHPVATMLSRFYKESAPIEIDGKRYHSQLERDIQYSLRELSRAQYDLPAPLINTIGHAARELLTSEPALFETRATHNKIIEGHGDLRPGHICLKPRPVIFDCLEFNRQFRLIDPADELAFLAMECERLGASFVGQEFFRIYQQITGDSPPSRLVNFYKASRACLRARLAIWHTHELEMRDWPKWQELADSYLRLAAAYQ